MIEENADQIVVDPDVDRLPVCEDGSMFGEEHISSYLRFCFE